MGIVEIFNLIFLSPLINLLVLILHGLQALHIPGALGFSILALTILIRLLVWPLTTKQIRSAQKMFDLKPHLDELKKKHGSDKQALSSAQMALYKEHGVNPAGGCLPALIQIPIFIALYQAIINIIPGAGGSLEHLNSLLYSDALRLSSPADPNFFGINLALKPSEFTSYGILLLLVPIITAALTFIQSKMTLPKPIKHHKDEPKKEKVAKQEMEETMSAVQSQMVYLMPLMVGYFAFNFPVGLAIYWNSYTILGIIQQYMVSGWGGLEDLINARALKRNS